MGDKVPVIIYKILSKFIQACSFLGQIHLNLKTLLQKQFVLFQLTKLHEYRYASTQHATQHRKFKYNKEKKLLDSYIIVALLHVES